MNSQRGTQRSTDSSFAGRNTMSMDKPGGGIMKLLTGRSTARSTGAGTIERLRPILTKRAQRLACLEFFILIVFMIGFIFLVWLHEDIERVYSLEHVMQIQMTKQFGDHSYTFDDINDVHEVWEFIDLSLIPTVVKHKDEVGHFLPYEEWGFLAYYNRVIGGIRFVQERSKDKPCEYQRLDEFYGNCQPLHTHNHHSFGYPACEGNYTVTDDEQTDDHADDHTDDLVDDASVSYNITACYHPEDYEGAVDFYHDEGFTMDEETKRFELWVDLFDDEEVIQKRVKYLKDRHWLDRETKSVSIEFLVYNGQDEPLICKVVLKFDFTRVGYVKPSADIETIPLSPYFHLGWLKIAFEVFYVLIILYLVLTESREVYDQRRFMKGKKNRTWFKAFKKHYWEDEGSSGNMIDILNIGIGIALCIEWLLLVQHIRDVEVGMKQLHRPSGQVQYDDNDADIWSKYHHDIIEIEHNTQLAVENMIIVRSLSVFVVFGMIFQMFKVWEGIPSLQGVSDTIVIAGKGLMSFSLVIICLVTLFAGAAMLAFGQQMEEFHDIPSSFINTLLIMTKGEATIYERQYEIDPVFSSVWHWLLVCIMYLVCLNLVLCILVDAYGEAHSAHENADRLTMPTLMEQTYDTVVYYSMELWADAQRRASKAQSRIASALVTGRSTTSTNDGAGGVGMSATSNRGAYGARIAPINGSAASGSSGVTKVSKPSKPVLPSSKSSSFPKPAISLNTANSSFGGLGSNSGNVGPSSPKVFSSQSSWSMMSSPESTQRTTGRSDMSTKSTDFEMVDGMRFSIDKFEGKNEGEVVSSRYSSTDIDSGRINPTAF